MKLYLSSYRLGEEPEALRRLVGRTGRAGVILNACDVFADRTRIYEREAQDMRSLGFDAEELDLRQYFHGRGDLRGRLETCALVWVVGGNAFVLARPMTAAGFAQAAREGLSVYAGYSAGACVAGPDLEGIHLMDDPGVIPTGYEPTMPATTLGFVPWRIVPQWRSDHPEAANADGAVRHLEAAGLAFRALADGDAIVLDRDPA